MKMMSKNGPNTANEIKETFAIFNASGRCAAHHVVVHVTPAAARFPWPSSSP